MLEKWLPEREMKYNVWYYYTKRAKLVKNLNRIWIWYMILGAIMLFVLMGILVVVSASFKIPYESLSPIHVTITWIGGIIWVILLLLPNLVAYFVDADIKIEQLSKEELDHLLVFMDATKTHVQEEWEKKDNNGVS